jgi:hypothetical protein
VHTVQQNLNIHKKELPKKDKEKPVAYTIDEFIEIVKKIEKRRPNWTPRQVLESLHNIAGTNDEKHRRMMQTEEGNSLLNVIDNKDIIKLGGMLVHSNVDQKYETGVVKDDTNQNLALSHVLTGIGAGLSRRKVSPSELVDGFLPALGDLATAGSDIDNLYTETLAGDLGQSAVLYNAGEQDMLVGPDTEATDAELVGDIDGFIIGSELSSTTLKDEFKSGELKLSTLLESYYHGKHVNRFNNISNLDTQTLKEETQNFADNYAYQKHGMIGGLFTEVGSEADGAVDKYSEWLASKKKPSKSIIKKSNPLPQNGKIMASGLHIRVRPNLSSTIIGMYFRGDIIKIIGNALGSNVEGNTVWHKTDRGFISSQYVSTISSSDQSNHSNNSAVEKTEEIKITVKSFIAPIGNNVGYIICPGLNDPFSVASNAKLRAFALAMDQIIKENPKNDAMGKKYRLYSSRKFTIYYNNDKITRIDVSKISTDVGDEGPLQPQPLTIFNDVYSSNPAKFSFEWAGKGKPNALAEPGFQIVCPRLSVYIWHSIRGDIELVRGRPVVTNLDLSESKFPSTRVFVNGVKRPDLDHEQGEFKQLWNSHPSNPFMVE